MKSLHGKYLLSVIEHKSQVKIADIILTIINSYQNNYRDRNPQLGKVEAVNDDDNPLGLKVGDIVAVNHRVFYKAQAGKEGHRFEYQEHIEHDGVKLFRPLNEHIYFKYNNDTPELINGYIICTGVEEHTTLGFDTNTGEFLHSKEFKQEGTVLIGNDRFPTGSKISVLKHAFYLITIDKVDYFKVNENEVVILNGEPANDYFTVEYLDDTIEHSLLDLSFVKKPIFCYAKKDDGELIYVWKNQGLKLGNKMVINDDNVILYKDEIDKVNEYTKSIQRATA